MRRDRTVGEFSVKKFNCHIFHRGVWFDSLRDIARMYGLKYDCLRHRLNKKRKMPVYACFTDCELITETVREMVADILGSIEVTVK